MALACGMLLSPQLWLTRPSEGFPMVAPISGLAVLAPPQPLDAVLFVGTLVLCALAAILPRRSIFAALFCACVLLALPDMMRWQPWFYLYLGLMGTLAFVPQGAPGRRTRGRVARPGALQVLRLMGGCVYLYSGANKLNAAFFEERLRGFLASMPSAIGDGPVAAALTYSAPGLEIAAGLGLILGGYRVRHAALVLGVSTNLFVLAALIPAGANTVVWPWNAAMIVLLVTLYAGRDEEPIGSPKAPRRAKRLLEEPPGYLYAAAVCILFAVMPALGVAGYWPAYLSFALYSQNTPEASVTVDGRSTTVTSMAYEALNVPAYPAPAVYKAVAESTCAMGPKAHGRPRGSVLVIRAAPDILAGGRESREYACGDLLVEPPVSP